MPTRFDNSSQLLIAPVDRLKFISLFTGLSTVALAIGTVLMRYLTIPITGTSFDSGLVQGIFIGIAQWYVIRTYIRAKFWVLATTFGWAISVGIGSRFLVQNSFLTGFILQGIAFVCLGAAQWWILHRQIEKYSWIWIFIYILPISIAILLAPFLSNAVIFRGLIIWVIPSICLCLFHRKVRSMTIVDLIKP